MYVHVFECARGRVSVCVQTYVCVWVRVRVGLLGLTNLSVRLLTESSISFKLHTEFHN